MVRGDARAFSSHLTHFIVGRFPVTAGPANTTNTTTLLHWKLCADLTGDVASNFVLWDTPGWPCMLLLFSFTPSDFLKKNPYP